MSRRDFLRCVAGGAVFAAGALSGLGCGPLGRGNGSLDDTSSSRLDQADPQEKGTMAMGDQPSADTVGHGDWDISVCGLNCAKCGLLESGECGGCRGSLDRHWSPNCEFVPCAKDKGHRYCFECADFPCDKLEAFAADGHEHHRLAVENMKEMRAVGLEEWIARQPRAVFCPGWRL